MDEQIRVSDGELYTVKEVAALLRLSRRSVFDKIKAGIIPSIRIGRTLRIRRDTINQMINDSTRGTLSMEHYMTSREAAEYLRTSPFYLANLRHRCRGPAYHQIGSKVLYTIQALDVWAMRSPRRKPRDLRAKKAV